MEVKQFLDRLPVVLSIICVVVLILHVPKNVLLRFRRKEKKVELRDTSPTGEWLTAGVIYSPSFLARTEEPTIKDPASFTPYIDDYLLPIARPKRKPFPNY